MEAQALDRPPEPPEAMVPPSALAPVMDGDAMSITDEALAAALFATWQDQHGYVVDWDGLDGDVRLAILEQARTARRLLLPSSPDELRMERGKAAWEATGARGWEALQEHTQEMYCDMADAVLAKKSEQDGDGT